MKAGFKKRKIGTIAPKIERIVCYFGAIVWPVTWCVKSSKKSRHAARSPGLRLFAEEPRPGCDERASGVGVVVGANAVVQMAGAEHLEHVAEGGPIVDMLHGLVDCGLAISRRRGHVWRAMTVPSSHRQALFAHVGPFALFMLGFALIQLVQAVAGKSDVLLLAQPQYWVFPLQTLVCAAALVFFWKRYDFGSQRVVPLAVGVGIVVFVIWVSPQMIFGQPRRIDGFDPSVFAGDPAVYWATVLSRFTRLVVVVPLIEELFWRGFLQRYLVDERFETVAIGRYTHGSFWGVVLGFVLVHALADYPAAAITGAIYGWLYVRTKTLLAPIVAHAITNLALGLYIMKTGQWGFW